MRVGGMSLVRLLSWVAFCVWAVSGSAQEPHVTGAPGGVLYGPLVSLQQAKDIASVVTTLAVEAEWAVAVAIVDPDGMLVYFERMDGVAASSPDRAFGSAVRAAAMVQWARTLADPAIRRDAESVVADPPNGGALPLFVDGRFIGAIGVNGAGWEGDHQIVRAAVELSGHDRLIP